MKTNESVEYLDKNGTTIFHTEGRLGDVLVIGNDIQRTFVFEEDGWVEIERVGEDRDVVRAVDGLTDREFTSMIGRLATALIG